MKKLIKGVAIALVGLAGSNTTVVYAHTALAASIPADQAVLAAAPADVKLSFSAPVRLTAITLQTEQGDEPLRHSTRNVNQDFVVALPALAPGVYVVAWRAVAEDTHVMTGRIEFTVSS